MRFLVIVAFKNGLLAPSLHGVLVLMLHHPLLAVLLQLFVMPFVTI